MNWSPFKSLHRDIYFVSWELFKIMIPTLLVVKLFDMAGGVAALAWAMGPAMQLIGLPDDTSIVLTTIMLTNVYAGFIIMAGMESLTELTMAQATSIAIFLLIAHGLPVECMITRRAGVRLRVMVPFRIVMAFLAAGLVHWIATPLGIMQDPAAIQLPAMDSDPTLLGWLVDQTLGLIFIQAIIIVLLAFLALLKVIGVERLIKIALTPFLKMLGIGADASTIAVVGITLGISFGGGLMIKEVDRGQIPQKDIFLVVMLMGLLHSIIEDTSIAMLLGPSLIIILIGRVVFSILVMLLVKWLVLGRSEYFWKKYLVNELAVAQRS